eukprot:362080-Chlamydomonas_euryale.AAC.3
MAAAVVAAAVAAKDQSGDARQLNEGEGGGGRCFLGKRPKRNVVHVGNGTLSRLQGSGDGGRRVSDVGIDGALCGACVAGALSPRAWTRCGQAHVPGIRRRRAGANAIYARRHRALSETRISDRRVHWRCMRWQPGPPAASSWTILACRESPLHAGSSPAWPCRGLPSFRLPWETALDAVHFANV